MAESVNGTLSYLLSDPVLVSVASSVNTSGVVAATQFYSPYGGVRYQSGMLPTDYGFTHQRSEASTSGLDYYGARYYDPVAGQFASADRTLLGGPNRYGYVLGNPETLIDPTGFGPPPCGDLDPGECIQFWITLGQFFISTLFNAWGVQAPALGPTTPSVIQAESPAQTPTDPFIDQGMNIASQIGSLFNDNGSPPGALPESGPGPNGEAPFDESYQPEIPSYVFRYGLRTTADTQSTKGKKGNKGNNDGEERPPSSGTGSAGGSKGSKSHAASSTASGSVNPFLRHGIAEALQRQFLYTDLRNAQFGPDPVPSTSAAGQPNQSPQWNPAAPCACGNPVIVPWSNPAPGNTYPSPSTAPSEAPEFWWDPIFGVS